MSIDNDDELLTADIEAQLRGMGMVPRDDASAAPAASGAAPASEPAKAASGEASAPAKASTGAASEPASTGADTPAAPAADGPARDNNGRFVGKPKEGNSAAPSTETPAAAPTDAPAPGPAGEAPKSWTGEAKSKWGELPDWAKAEVLKRENDVQRGAAKWDDDRVAGKRVREIFAPHAAEMQQQGVRPEQAVAQLFATHNMLRNAPPAQRAQLLVKVAKDYGVDLSAAVTSGDPEKDRLAAQNAELEAQRGLDVYQRQQADHASVQDQVEAFFADPAYPRAAELTDDIQRFLTGGWAKSLPEAYQLADKLRRDAAPVPASQPATTSPADKAAEARRSAVSVSGAPGSTAPTTTHRSGSYEDAASRALDEILSR